MRNADRGGVRGSVPGAAGMGVTVDSGEKSNVNGVKYNVTQPPSGNSCTLGGQQNQCSISWTLTIRGDNTTGGAVVWSSQITAPPQSNDLKYKNNGAAEATLTVS